MSAGSNDDSASQRPTTTLDAWLITDIGVVREHNEDSACSVPASGFFIVADGMGGHAAGEVASAMAVETVKKSLDDARAEIDLFKEAPTDSGRRGLVSLLQNAVLSAHQAVYQRGQSEPDKAGMGTTLDVVLVAGPEAFVAHVGDSRTYLIRDGRTSQITTDHTVAEVLVIEGKLTIEEAQVSPLRTILVNAIGVSADVGVEMAHVTLKKNDRLLLCSDGLHDYFPAEDEIASKMSTDAPGEQLKEMVELAKTRGGHDNITGVAVHIIDVPESVPSHVEPDATQPVGAELGGVNPFASDEPTETAFPPPLPTIGGPTPTPSMRATQPMRAVAELGELGAKLGRASAAVLGTEKTDPGVPVHGKKPADEEGDVTTETPPAGVAVPKPAEAKVEPKDAKDVGTADTAPTEKPAAEPAEAKATDADAKPTDAPKPTDDDSK